MDTEVILKLTNMSFHKALKTAFKEYCEKRGYDWGAVREVAKKAGISSSFLSLLLREKRRCKDYEMMARLARALGKDPEYFKEFREHLERILGERKEEGLAKPTKLTRLIQRFTAKNVGTFYHPSPQLAI